MGWVSFHFLLSFFRGPVLPWFILCLDPLRIACPCVPNLLCMFVAHVLNAADLWRVILCPFTSWNLFIISRTFLTIGFLWFPMYNIMSPAKRENLTFSFPLCTPLIFFFCLIAPDSSTTSTMLKWSVDSGRPCFISDFFQGFLHLGWCCLWVSSM